MWRALILCLLPTLALADTPKPSDSMQALILYYDAIHAAAPDLKIEIDEADISLKLTTPDGKDIRMYPDNLYLSLLQTTSEAERAAVMQTFVDTALKAYSADPATPELDLTAIYPVIRPALILPADVREKVVVQDFPGGLVEYWVQDSPGSTLSVNVDALKAAKLDVTSLQKLAIANLTQKAQAVQMQSAGPMSMLLLDGYYESSLLLLPEIWQGLDARMGSVVVAIPTREVVLLVDGTDTEAVAALRAVIQQPFQTQPYAISPDLFLWQTDHWTVLPN
jgi:hypothetical protein